MAGISDALQRKLDTLSDAPGVYLWKDAEGNVGEGIELALQRVGDAGHWAKVSKIGRAHV